MCEPSRNVESCPFCGFRAPGGEYELLLVSGEAPKTARPNVYLHAQHMEALHAEGTSPFVAADAVEDETNLVHSYGECPVDGCGEMILANEMADHLELHAEQDGADEDVGAPTTQRSLESRKAGSASIPGSRVVGETQKSAIRQWKQLLLLSSRRGSPGKDQNKAPARPQKERRKLGVRFVHAPSTAVPRSSSDQGCIESRARKVCQRKTHAGLADRLATSRRCYHICW